MKDLTKEQEDFILEQERAGDEIDEAEYKYGDIFEVLI